MIGREFSQKYELTASIYPILSDFINRLSLTIIQDLQHFF